MRSLKGKVGFLIIQYTVQGLAHNSIQKQLVKKRKKEGGEGRGEGKGRRKKKEGSQIYVTKRK